jgi:hypothetical protein
VADEKQYTARDIATHLAKAIQEKVDAYAGEFEDLRKRELKQAEKRLRKNASMGYGGPAAPGTPGLQPARPVAMAKTCKGCGKPHPVGKCMGKGEEPAVEKDEVSATATPPKSRSPKGIRGADPETVKIPKEPWKIAARQALGKEETSPGVLPGDKPSKVAEASKGSGGKVTKGKALKKATAGAAPATTPSKAPATTPAPAPKKIIPLSDLASIGQSAGARKMPAPSLPGLTALKPAGGMHPEVRQSLHELKLAAGLGQAVNAAGAPRPFVKKPGADAASMGKKVDLSSLRAKLAGIKSTQAPGPTPVAQANKEIANFKPIATSPTAMPGGQLTGAGPSNPAMAAGDSGVLAADKKAAGVGLFNNLFSRLRGAGNKTWEAMRGAGPPSEARAMRATGARMALSEPVSNGLRKAELGDCALCRKPEHRGACD